MTDKSRRDIEKRIENLDSESVTFPRYCEFLRQTIYNEGDGPTQEEFFGRKLTASERTEFWHEIRPIWDGEKEPPDPP